LASSVQAGDWSAVRIAITPDAKYLRMDGSLVAWRDRSDGSDDLYVYDGASIQQITNDSRDEYNVNFDDGRLTWTIYNSGQVDLYQWDSVTTTTSHILHTAPDGTAIPQVRMAAASGDNIAVMTNPATGSDQYGIWFYDGATWTQWRSTANTWPTSGSQLAMSGDDVYWLEYDPNTSMPFEPDLVFRHDGQTLTQIASGIGEVARYSFGAEGDTVSWREATKDEFARIDDHRIPVYDGTQRTDIPCTRTTPTFTRGPRTE